MDTVIRTKWQPTDWENILTINTFNSDLIYNIYKEFKKLDFRETNNPMKKWGTDLNKNSQLGNIKWLRSIYGSA